MSELRSSDEIRREMFDVTPTVEKPWTWWDKLVFALTRQVSARVYRQRMAGMERDHRCALELELELTAALREETSNSRKAG